ncbi:MAG: ATP-binding protein, partial [Rhodospirillales bacterium]|nr:ATP-binding protein [Rhodospirillales bacterium]
LAGIRKTIIVPLAILILAGASTVTATLLWWSDTRDTARRSMALRAIEQQYATTFADERRLLESTLEGIASRSDLPLLFLAGDRDGLYAAAAPLYARLNEKFDVTHFYFTGIDRVNFLRAHKKGRHGDVIDRRTTLIAHDTGETGAGLEIGPLGTFTLRVVIPWEYEGRRIGYLELGKEIDALLTDLRVTAAYEVLPFIDKNLIDRKEWEEGMRMLGHKPAWDRYRDYVLAASLPQSSNPFLQYAIKDVDPEAPDEFFKETQAINNHHVDVFRLLIRDVGGNPVARVILFNDVTEPTLLRRNIIIVAIGASLVAAVIILSLFWKFLGRVETRIANTERLLVEAKEDAERSNEAKSRFLSNMTHELRTPLNAILGFSEVIKRQVFGPVSPPKYREYIDDIHASGQHLLDLVNDILDISKFDSGNMTLHLEPFDVSEMTRECVEMLRPRAETQRIKLICAPPGDAPILLADRRAIKQCVINLLANAVKFTPADGRVTLSCSATPQWYVIAVSDTGIGIPQDEIPKLAEPFIQVERYRTARIQEGTGLGLALTRRLIEMHGGTMLIESVEGAGTTVSLRIPRAPCPVPAV